MRVLVVAAGFHYPLTSGGAQRTAALLRALGRRHEVVFSAPIDLAERADAERALGDAVKRFAWVDVAAGRVVPMPNRGGRLRRAATYFRDLLTHPLPFSFRRQTTTWREALAEELEHTDAVLCRHTALFPLVESVGASRVVIDADDLAFALSYQEARSGKYGLGGVLYWAEAARTYLAEQWLTTRCARVLTASARDGRRLWSRRTTVVANGMDLQQRAEGGPRDPQGIIFVGHCGYEPNSEGLEWFVRAVWPGIRRRAPQAQFTIVGREANLETLPFLRDAPEILCAPDVPSVAPWIEGATVSVVPLHRGSGTRIKILESLAHGTPVVSTPLGASGLTGDFGQDEGLVLATTADEMAAAVSAILADPAPALAAATRGEAAVHEAWSWQRTTAPLTEGIERWIAARNPGQRTG